MNTIANHINAQLIAARCCDALDPCATCSSKRTQAAALRHAERVAALTCDTDAPTIPAPRMPSDLQMRLASA